MVSTRDYCTDHGCRPGTCRRACRLARLDRCKADNGTRVDFLLCGAVWRLHGLSRRSRSIAAIAQVPDRVLSDAVGWRRGWRDLCQPDRTESIYDPSRMVARSGGIVYDRRCGWHLGAL